MPWPSLPPMPVVPPLAWLHSTVAASSLALVFPSGYPSRGDHGSIAVTADFQVVELYHMVTQRPRFH